MKIRYFCLTDIALHPVSEDMAGIYIEFSLVNRGAIKILLDICKKFRKFPYNHYEYQGIIDNHFIITFKYDLCE